MFERNIVVLAWWINDIDNERIRVKIAELIEVLEDEGQRLARGPEPGKKE